ncbi:MAG: AAA family ATPase [Albidovulum sp.]|nr:AAA family ATPase [Albidovulum sp.]
MPLYSHVQFLKIRNFKGIAKLDLALDESLTLLAGVNGVGKTSAIEAMLGAVTYVWSELGPVEKEAQFNPSGDLVRYGVPEGEVTLELANKHGRNTEFKIPVSARKLGKFDLNFTGTSETPMPLVVYYDQNRIGGLESKDRWRDSKTNREAALDTTPNALSDFKTWYYEKEGDEAREALERGDLGYRDPEVQAVREVLKNIAGCSTKLRSRNPEGSSDRVLFVRKNDCFDIPFEALSGGEKAFFLLAVDLARRLLLEFPGSTLAEAPGFVCIDQIELHLHPAWQRKILTSLIDLFPCCQFVVSTHSPQVIGSVAAKHVRLLESDGNGQIDAIEPRASKGRDSNYVLEGILDTPEQDPEVKKLFGKCDELIDAGAFEEADSVLKKLDALVEGRSSRVAVRRAKSKRLQRAAK